MMLYFDHTCYDQTHWITYGENSHEPLEACNLEEYYQIESISHAIANIDKSGPSFAYFNHILSDKDYDALQQIRIKDFGTLIAFGDSYNLQAKVNRFLHSILMNNSDDDSTYLSTLITKLVKRIILASEYADAVVSLVAYNDGLKPYSPYWHIDKTHEEEIGLKENQRYSSMQYVFITSLKGASTIYYPIDYTIRTKISHLAQESSHTYYWSDELFNESNAHSAKLWQGSVHLAGHKYGAIHGTPKEQERLLMIVTPSDSSTIIKLKETTYA